MKIALTTLDSYQTHPFKTRKVIKFSLDVSRKSLPDYEAVMKTVRKQQKFYFKNAVNSEALGLLLKLENVVRSEMLGVMPADNGLPV